MAIYRARAPFRVSLAGGGTDVPPYCDEHGGCVISFTIAQYAYCTALDSPDDKISITSAEYNVTVTGNPRAALPLDGRLDLAKVIWNRFRPKRNMEIRLTSEAVPGSGLGSSSAVVVALIGALTAAAGGHCDPHAIAHLAFVAEREDLGIPGGKQDQYASAFGGCNFIEFGPGPTVEVTPLRLRDDVVDELQSRLILCFTGGVRTDLGILDEQQARYRGARREVSAILDEMKGVARETRRALMSGALGTIGPLLDQEWSLKRRLAAGIATVRADALYNVSRRHGCEGGKLLGAGGGGYLLLMVDPDGRRRVVEALEAEGGRVVPLVFEWHGLRTWRPIVDAATRIPDMFTEAT